MGSDLGRAGAGTVRAVVRGDFADAEDWEAGSFTFLARIEERVCRACVEEEASLAALAWGLDFDFDFDFGAVLAEAAGLVLASTVHSGCVTYARGAVTIVFECSVIAVAAAAAVK
jgi:hypothetical protein